MTGRDEIYDGNLVRVTFGWSDRTHPPGETYRFDFYDPETFAIAVITASEKKSIAGVTVSADKVKFLLADLEDLTAKLRQHLAQISN